MADIITSDQLFYTAQAADIWSSINPQLGEQIGLAAAVANGIRVYNIAYPPPPPGNMWSGITGIVLIAGAIAIGVAAYYAYAASAAGGGRRGAAAPPPATLPSRGQGSGFGRGTETPSEGPLRRPARPRTYCRMAGPPRARPAGPGIDTCGASVRRGFER